MQFLRDVFVSAAGRYKLVAARTLEVSGLRLSDSTDQTKVATFAMSGISTGTTRTYTFPNASGTLAVLGQPTLLSVAYLIREDPTSAVGNFTWTNMPAATNSLYGTGATNYVRRLDLTYAAQARFSFHVAVAGVAGAKLFLRYSTDGASFSTPSPAIEATFGASTGQFTSGWTNLDAAMKGDVWVGVYGSGGDGVADPRFTTISAEFR